MSLIEVTDLRKSYGGRPVVDGISLAVEEGEIFGVLGSNGAGKTTTVEHILGLRVPDSGTVRVCGLDPHVDRAKTTLIMGAQLQESEMQGKLTVAESLELFAACYPRAADWRVLAERLGLKEKLNTRFAQLSGGQKQRLAIALALVGNPRVVILDELTTGLDPAARREVWSLIEDVRASGVTILLVTHFMEEAQRLCDRLAIFDRGRVVALDTPSGLVAQSASGTVISFTPSRPLEEDELAALPGLASVTQHEGRITLGGTDETVNAVISLLARNGVSAHQLRVTDSTLDDAYLDLTGADA
ncbi:MULTISPECIES: ABC transporter ATP-binding protein [Streptomyces]|uniref:ABC transporter ATP-binding protein n=1 Tax=Streptomyces TaxID=1883 RepID=UPI000CD56DE2|nr:MULTISPECIES: ABC transporter ATP-binding protein [Streptomyces]